MITHYSDLKIILSNCLIGGSAWNVEQIDLIEILRQALYDTNGIDFRSINTNNVSGEHTSTTIAITGMFYNLNQNVNKKEMIDIEDLMSIIIQKIPEFTCAEIRIEHTRNRSIFSEKTHPRLARTL
jgi:hypothetical protein